MELQGIKITEEEKSLLDKFSEAFEKKYGKQYIYDKNNIPILLSIYDTLLNTDKNILLFGGVGTGKTVMMKVVAETMRGSHRYFQVRRSKEIVEEYKNNREVIDFMLRYEGVSGRKYSFCIDDFGQESFLYKTEDIIGDMIERYYEMKIERQTNARIHLTMNNRPEGIADKYGARIADRIAELYLVMELKGESKR